MARGRVRGKVKERVKERKGGRFGGIEEELFGSEVIGVEQCEEVRGGNCHVRGWRGRGQLLTE